MAIEGCPGEEELAPSNDQKDKIEGFAISFSVMTFSIP